MNGITFSVFTKPWPNKTLDELAQLVLSMGFNAIEYPYRQGFQVQPTEGKKGILNLCRTFNTYGLQIASIAAGIDVAAQDGAGEIVGIDEPLFAFCGEAGIPIIRICQSFNRKLGFSENLDALRRKYDVVSGLCEKYGVTLGVQMHYGSADITASYDSYILLKDYNPKHIAAVWDAGHSGLSGENPGYALDCLWDHLCMVNFKAAYWFRSNGPEAAQADWGVHWTTGINGMCPWDEAVAYLLERGYQGVVCLPAEYSDEKNVEAYTREDLGYIKGLFERKESAQ